MWRVTQLERSGSEWPVMRNGIGGMGCDAQLDAAYWPVVVAFITAVRLRGNTPFIPRQLGTPALLTKNLLQVKLRGGCDVKFHFKADF